MTQRRRTGLVLNFPGEQFAAMLTFSVALVAGFTVTTSNPQPGAPIQELSRTSSVVLFFGHLPGDHKHLTLASNHAVRGDEHQEALPLLERQPPDQQSLGAMLGQLIAVASALSSFADGLAILQSTRRSYFKTAARIIQTFIEAYTVGHLQLYSADRSSQANIIAAYSMLAALPSGMLVSALFGQRLAPESKIALLMSWLLPSVSFGLVCYVIIFHLVNKAFDSSTRKKSLYSLFFLGQLVATGLEYLST